MQTGFRLDLEILRQILDKNKIKFRANLEQIQSKFTCIQTNFRYDFDKNQIKIRYKLGTVQTYLDRIQTEFKLYLDKIQIISHEIQTYFLA